MSRLFKHVRRWVIPRRLRLRLEASLIKLIRNNRLHHVRFDGDPGIDVTFLDYKHVSTAPNRELIELVTSAGQILSSQKITKTLRSKELDECPLLFDFGNHYLLLTALAEARKAKKIVEIGTAGGASLWAWLQAECVEMVSTWDIRPLSDSYSWLGNEDCRKLVVNTLNSQSDRWKQFVEDLSESEVWKQRCSEIADADIVFIDGPHDGRFESIIWSKIKSIKNAKEILLIFDDIRVSSMVDFWADLDVPKLDATFIGHQSGTGLAILEVNRI